MTFTSESQFEEALIQVLLSKKGWSHGVIKNPTEQDLLDNWASILFDNNRGIDRLNDTPLTDGEMQQIIEQITELRTPLRLNGFINGKTVSIKRDNPADALHYGKEVSLKIYDRHEIAAGQSRYQIVQQPRFATKSKILNDRRGDLLLLINGMPLIHIELKKSGVPVSQAYHQIENYARSGVFTGLFSLVQIFVAMEPSETVYFANPGPDGRWNPDFYFHWADFDNEPINDWRQIAEGLLSIPMAHQLIGFYTVPDTSDGILKVMRSYQYHAARAISLKVHRTDWKSPHALGGYIWHTTGSGKTMTSFKSAQLIANSQDADKVVFLMDRIELGTQSLKQYRAFSEDNEEIQATENTGVLVTKLKSKDPKHTLIVTSIQKMSNIKDEDEGLQSRDIELINDKRIVFIVDEAHRSTFGDMLIDIKQTFTSAIFFGFTGTPVLDENQKKMNTTSTIFGDELHRYSIADGIRDKNVLGFDPYKVIYNDRAVRTAVALAESRSITVEEALADPAKAEVFNRFMNEVSMVGSRDAAGRYTKGIEDYLPKSQYEQEVHQRLVVEHILKGWVVSSQNYKFHALFATSSIPEAIEYYRWFKASNPDLKVTALFDPTIENNERAAVKEAALVEILTDYNERYRHDFTLATHARYKKDVANRLAHKEAYRMIERTPEKQLDLLIVVDQMLTGFDSKWINTLYLDKVLKYENIIQAFSRTNRLFSKHEKPFGTIRYYRYPHTMEQYIEQAVKLYSGDKPVDLFVDRLYDNLTSINHAYIEIQSLFAREGIADFARLPDSHAVRRRFAKLFSGLNRALEAATIQGFRWDKLTYTFDDRPDQQETCMVVDEQTYLILALRYKELFAGGGGGGGAGGGIPYDLERHLTEIDTGKIDTDYMNSRFDKYLRIIKGSDQDEAEIQAVLDELHKSFATLTQEDQKYATIFLHDVQSGTVQVEADRSFRDYITQYSYDAKQDQIHKLAQALGLDQEKLSEMMIMDITEKNINDYGRLDELKDTVDKSKAKAYFEKKEGQSVGAFTVNMKVAELLRRFIMEGGFDIEEPIDGVSLSLQNDKVTKKYTTSEDEIGSIAAEPE
jgi:type I restriction enzyme R subunit